MMNNYFGYLAGGQNQGNTAGRETIKASLLPVLTFAIQKEKSHPDMVPPPDIQDRIVHIRRNLVAGKAFTFLIFVFIAFVGSVYVTYTKVVDSYMIYGSTFLIGMVSGMIGVFNFFHERKLKDAVEKRGVKRLIDEIYFDTLKGVKTVYRLYWILLAAAIAATILKYPPLMQLFGSVMHEIEKIIYLFTKTKGTLPVDDILLIWLIASLLFMLGDYFYVRFIMREVRRADSA